MALGTPGEDQQTQSMLQTFLNVVNFGMNVQEAIEAPKFGSYNFPGWFAPHPYYPGRICIERRLAEEVGDPLRQKGREVVEWEDWTMLAGGGVRGHVRLHDRIDARRRGPAARVLCRGLVASKRLITDNAGGRRRGHLIKMPMFIAVGRAGSPNAGTNAQG